jgi:hypothetical protein
MKRAEASKVQQLDSQEAAAAQGFLSDPALQWRTRPLQPSSTPPQTPDFSNHYGTDWSVVARLNPLICHNKINSRQS